MNPEELIRSRWSPESSDDDYLVLRDLRDYLDGYRTDDSIRVLDFGAGLSPYRALFPNADYQRADIAGTPGVNFSVSDDGTTNAPNASFDLVLSTQVAEHLPDAGTYFREVYRVLKPEGQLVLTTHGIWEDHPTPGDYQRWTGDGLRRDLERSGLAVKEIVRLSCGWRAFASLGCQLLDRSAHRSVWVRRIWHRVKRPVQSLLSRVTADFAKDVAGKETLYLVVCAVASRPL
jgi:SAM-dependent methyltransferase